MFVQMISNRWSITGLPQYLNELNNYKTGGHYMKTNFAIRNLVACVFFALVPNLLVAQEVVAKISKIATVSEGVISEMRNETSLARLRRSNQKNWLNVKRNDELFFNDNLELKENIRLRIQVKNQLQEGNFVFIPHPDLKEPGLFEIKEAQDGVNLVSIEIQQGSAIFSVMQNRINTTTQGLQSIVESGSTTRALFHVRPDSSGEIYLQQGRIIFPDDPTASRLDPGEAAHFRDGRITKIFVPAAGLVTEYKDFIKINNSTIWKPPLLKRPVFWIGTAAVGIGTALLIAKPWESNHVSGNLNVNWGSN